MTRTNVCYLNVIPSETQKDNGCSDQDIEFQLIEPMTLLRWRQCLIPGRKHHCDDRNTEQFAVDVETDINSFVPKTMKNLQKFILASE